MMMIVMYNDERATVQFFLKRMGRGTGHTHCCSGGGAVVVVVQWCSGGGAEVVVVQ